MIWGTRGVARIVWEMKKKSVFWRKVKKEKMNKKSIRQGAAREGMR